MRNIFTGYIFSLYAIIFLEGYVVLSTELLAIRQLIPFVGNGTQTISIIIAAVLMPLSAGYYVGGKFSGGSIRRRLISNVMIAALIFSVGFSYLFLHFFFQFLSDFISTHRIVQTALFSVLFLVYPVFLLGQTVPLISNYFRKSRRSNVTGVMVCISTVGSFLGAVMSTLVLMATIGVHNVILVNTLLLSVVVMLLSRRLLATSNGLMLVILCMAVMFNENWDRKSEVSGDYDVVTYEPLANHNCKSYSLRQLEKKFINAMAGNQALGIKEKKILFAGQGDFIFGSKDYYNHYDYASINGSKESVALWMGARLKKNQTLSSLSLKRFLYQNKEKYDLIALDFHFKGIEDRQDLVTMDLFVRLKQHLKEGGMMFMLFSTSPDFKSEFSRQLDSTIVGALGVVGRDVISDFNYWHNDRNQDVVYSYYNRNYSSDFYTDDLNTYYLDR